MKEIKFVPFGLGGVTYSVGHDLDDKTYEGLLSIWIQHVDVSVMKPQRFIQFLHSVKKCKAFLIQKL